VCEGSKTGNIRRKLREVEMVEEVEFMPRKLSKSFIAGLKFRHNLKFHLTLAQLSSMVKNKF